MQDYELECPQCHARMEATEDKVKRCPKCSRTFSVRGRLRRKRVGVPSENVVFRPPRARDPAPLLINDMVCEIN